MADWAFALRVGVTSIGTLGFALMACDPQDADPPPQAPPPSIVQNISYNTNIYVNSPSPAPTRTPLQTIELPPEEEAEPEVSSSGFATCDAYFSETVRCARSLTHSPHAIAELEKSLDITRKEDRIIAASGHANAKAEVSTRCEAALRAYDDAPCFVRR